MSILYTQSLGDLERNKFIENGDVAVKVTLGDTAAADSFSRMRVSTPQVIFNSMEPVEKKEFAYSSAVVGSGIATYVANTASHAFELSAANGDKATRSSKKLAEYIPGTSIMIFCTGVMGAGAANSRQRMGLFDDKNGVFFEQRDGVMGITFRTYTSGTAVDTHVSRADWNFDPMDGTGKNGLNLDFTKTQIFIIDLQWLGVGRVRFGFDVDGKVYYAHEMLNANNKTQVYMTTPRLPVRYEVENTGASAAQTDFRMICASVVSEGGNASDQFPRSTSNGITGIGTSTTKKPVLSLRINSGYVNAANIRLSDLSVVTTAKADHLFELWLNPTLTGASWGRVTNGIADKDVAASAVTGGTRLGAIYTSELTRGGLAKLQNKQFVLGSELTGVADIFTITATTLSGTDTAYASIDYEELY
jgi:hypothetical protein